MSILLADIDATCAALGFNDGNVYHCEADALQGLKHLIWILRRDNEVNEHRRHLGRGQVLQTDLLPMIMSQTDEDDISDVLLRLLVNLTSPTLLLYREELPKDGPGRRNFLELTEILQSYKGAFSLQPVWAALGKRLQKVLEIDWTERSEEQGLLIERILVLVRNVLQVPANPDTERRADNDASLHDQVLWALQQAGVLDLVLYIMGAEHENQYFLHALEIICLMYREQTAESLADASLQRSAAEKHRDEQELLIARRREKAKHQMRPPSGRHSRFGGTYVLQNVKSVSDNDIICHQSLPRAITMDFNQEKNIQKQSHRIVQEVATCERRSAFSVRLFLREFCIEILGSAFNNLVRQVRRILERSTTGNDDSYLLWAMRFFLEFNRLSDFQLQLVSEALSTPCFHWVLTRIQHHIDMITSDKKNARIWAKRLHIGVLAFKELLCSLIALQKVKNDDAQALYKMLLNNVCYVMEFRECVLHMLMNYNEAHSTKAYLRDVIEMVHIFFKLMENFCKGGVVVQKKSIKKAKRSKKSSKNKAATSKPEENLEKLENIWGTIAAQVSSVLASDVALPEEEHPLPFDAVSDKSMDDQKDLCMIKIHTLMRQEKFEHAAILMRSAREVWPENDCFGSSLSAPEDELMLLHDIFVTNLGSVENLDNNLSVIDGNDDGTDDEDDEEGISKITETDFRFSDFEKRLANPRVVRACTIVLSDWEKITTRALKSAVTILHRISFKCKLPAMLYQAVLFRIFQSVFHSPEEERTFELRRLGIYVIKQFVVMAQKNPKIYAELLFLKSVKEANEIEEGYDADNETNNKNAWSEEQEDELRHLHMENQNNPQTDQDVIDWIIDNLIDKTRTRRAVIRKMKDLGLIFKAPTKKSNALSKNAWLFDHDQRLRDLYDENRLHDDCLLRIMANFEGRTKNAVIKRMITLGLIADSSEIAPPKKKKSKAKKSSNGGDNDDDSDDSDDSGADQRERNKKPKKAKSNKTTAPVKPTVKVPFKLEALRKLMSELSDELKEVLPWLQESLSDAAEDIEDVPNSPEDGIPLVPFTTDQRNAMEDENFKFFLLSLGIQPPVEQMETYWRIPVHFRANDIDVRVKFLNGDLDEQLEEQPNTENVDDDIEMAPAIYSSEEDEDDNESTSPRQSPVNNLIYNDSDNDEGTIRTPIKVIQPAKGREKLTKKFNIFDMIKESESEEISMQSQELRNRLATLVDSDDSDNDTMTSGSRFVSKTFNRNAIIDSDSDVEQENTILNAAEDTSATKASKTLDSHFSSSAFDGSHSSHNTGINVSADMNATRNNKRERSESDESMLDEENVVPNKKAKKAVSRRAVIDDDDDE